MAGAVLTISSPEALAQSAEDFYCDRGRHALRLPKTYAELRKIGALLNEITTDGWDYGDYKTHKRELRFDGLTLTVTTFTNSPKYMVSSVLVSSPVWSVTGAFKVGQSIESAPVKAGDKRALDGPVMVAGEGDDAELTVRNGKITQISYRCYDG